MLVILIHFYLCKHKHKIDAFKYIQSLLLKSFM
jgi:hypothetical protein